MNIDLDAIPDFENVPDGNYLLEVVKANDIPEGKRSGLITFKIAEGPFAGRNVFFNLYLPQVGDKELAFSFFKQSATALGFSGTFSWEIAKDEMIGRKVWGRLKNEPYNDQMQLKVKSLRKVTDNDMKKLLLD